MIKIEFTEKNGKPWMTINLDESKIRTDGFKAIGEFLRVKFLPLEIINLQKHSKCERRN
jgi:hypothetical protein